MQSQENIKIGQGWVVDTWAFNILFTVYFSILKYCHYLEKKPRPKTCFFPISSEELLKAVSRNLTT